MFELSVASARQNGLGAREPACVKVALRGVKHAGTAVGPTEVCLQSDFDEMVLNSPS